MTDDIGGEPADNLPFESLDPYGIGEDEDSESGQPGNSGDDARRAGWPRPGDNRPRDSNETPSRMNFDRRRARDVVTEECVLRTHALTVEEVLDRLAGCWTGDPITLADLNASEYDSLVVGLIAERDREHERVELIRALGEEAARDGWSAIAITSAIRSILRTQASA